MTVEKHFLVGHVFITMNGEFSIALYINLKTDLNSKLNVYLCKS